MPAFETEMRLVGYVSMENRPIVLVSISTLCVHYNSSQPIACPAGTYSQGGTETSSHCNPCPGELTTDPLNGIFECSCPPGLTLVRENFCADPFVQ